MNFKDFYQKTENRLTDAVLSLWATGNKEMQQYLRYLISKDPLLSEVVFQNTFPWESDELTFEQTDSVFQKSLKTLFCWGVSVHQKTFIVSSFFVLAGAYESFSVGGGAP